MLCVVWGGNTRPCCVQDELFTYSADLQDKAALVVANKVDLVAGDGKEIIAELQSSTELPVCVISARDGRGIDAVRQALLEKVECLRAADGDQITS